MIKQICAAAALVSLSACASTPMVFRCPDLRTGGFEQKVPLSPYIEAIRRDARPGDTIKIASEETLFGGFREADLQAFIAANPEAFGVETGADNTLVSDWKFTGDADPARVLALSGGGQWGAFGAGFFQQLDKEGKLPRFDHLTGVSTGAMQVLFLAAANTDDAKQREHNLAELVDAYTIDKEKKIVHRGSQESALWRGSIAKLGPLRKLVEDKLCKSDKECRLIEDLAKAKAPAFVGYVDAESGDLMQADITQIARHYAGRKDRLREGRDCLAGVAMASAAVPAFYQQIQIESKRKDDNTLEKRTVFDGGVRQSVFFALHIEALRYVARLRNQQAKAMGLIDPEAMPDVDPRLYIVRNGPTIVDRKPESNKPRSVLGNGLHAYSLIVNQTEISSIETLHLLHSAGTPSYLVTADQVPVEDGAEVDRYGARLCTRSSDEREFMFLPRHMECLRELGAKKAKEPWLTIPVPPKPPRQ